MSTIAENLSKLISIKSDIASAITEKGGSVGTSFASYAQAIRDLPTGGGIQPYSLLAGTLTTLVESSFSGTIKNNYFSDFYKLTTVDLAKVTSIGYDAFYGCSALTTVNLPEASYIGAYAFYGCSALTTVNIPVASYIGYDAFNRCIALTTVDLPEVTSIDSYAFQNCSALTSIDLPKASYISDFAFGDCIKLITVSLPVASYIGSYAFQYCYSLTSVNLPVAEYIGYNAFKGCSALTSIDLPEAKTFGGVNKCSALTSLYLPNVININYNDYDIPLIAHNCSNISVIDCPNLLYCDSSIFSCLISNCSNLTTVNLPKLRIFGYQEFSSCLKLSNINLSNRVIFRSFLGSTYFAYNSYINWSELIAGETCCEDSYDFPSSVRSSVNSWCCYRSISMDYTNRCLSGDWRYIPHIDTFSQNDLRTVSLPYCHTLGVSAFANCSMLNSVSLPNVEFVAPHAFESCSNIDSIYLPKASFIGDYAFSGLHNLTAYLDKCEYIGNYGIWGATVYFSNISSVVQINSSKVYFQTIHVPSSLYDAFCNDSQWSRFKNQIRSINN